jgi:hypothetical protein
VDELLVPAGYEKKLSADCVGTISEGETKTCTITNDDLPAHLTVIKHVVNQQGGLTKTASDFTIHVATNNGPQIADFAGAEDPGVVVTLNQGHFEADEIDALGYTKTLNGDCLGTILIGESKTCTITNTDPFVPPTLPPAKLIVKKHVVNNDGTKSNVAADFTMNVTGSNVSNPSFPGDENGTEVTLAPGNYSVDEQDAMGYAKTRSQDCQGSIALGETKTCLITNDDPALPPPPHDGGGPGGGGNPPAKLIVIKKVINDNGGTKIASDFTMKIIAGVNPSQSEFAGDANGTEITLGAGSYSVDEKDSMGYAKSLSIDCFGTILGGETKTCTITNDDPGLPPPPQGGNGGGGGGTSSSTSTDSTVNTGTTSTLPTPTPVPPPTPRVLGDTDEELPRTGMGVEALALSLAPALMLFGARRKNNK